MSHVIFKSTGRIVFDDDDDIDKKICTTSGSDTAGCQKNDVVYLCGSVLCPFGALSASHLLKFGHFDDKLYCYGVHWRVADGFDLSGNLASSDSMQSDTNTSSIGLRLGSIAEIRAHLAGNDVPPNNADDTVDPRPLILLKDPGGALVFAGEQGGIVKNLRFASEKRCPVEIARGNWTFRRCQFHAPSFSPTFSACVVTGGQVRFEHCEFIGDKAQSLALMDIYGKWYDGKGYDRSQSRVEVIECDFRDSFYNGVMIGQGGTLSVEGSSFCGVGTFCNEGPGWERYSKQDTHGRIFQRYEDSELRLPDDDADESRRNRISSDCGILLWECGKAYTPEVGNVA
eukprot:TRINITY_DN20783_c0_g1_i1.p1 TRINITY_DN20783_c0_g1~~TRINITY_DN20783_c0_g1_i1.p1  ORF type:complete len:394 (-),score=4.66 TRINITY_DN20783_c0_g1_i1:328-1353(-)